MNDVASSNRSTDTELFDLVTNIRTSDDITSGQKMELFNQVLRNNNAQETTVEYAHHSKTIEEKQDTDKMKAAESKIAINEHAPQINTKKTSLYIYMAVMIVCTFGVYGLLLLYLQGHPIKVEIRESKGHIFSMRRENDDNPRENKENDDNQRENNVSTEHTHIPTFGETSSGPGDSAKWFENWSNNNDRYRDWSDGKP